VVFGSRGEPEFGKQHQFGLYSKPEFRGLALVFHLTGKLVVPSLWILEAVLFIALLGDNVSGLVQA